MPTYVLHVRFKDGTEIERTCDDKNDYSRRLNQYTNRYDVAGWWVTEERVIDSSYKETTLLLGIR